MRSFPAFLILTAVFQVSAAEYNREYLEHRVQKFGSLRNTAFILAGVGGVALAGGVILVSNGTWKTETRPGRTGARLSYAFRLFGRAP